MSRRDRGNLLARLGIAAALVGVVPGCSKQERVDPTAAPIEEFMKRVDAYVALHNQQSEAVGPLDETKSQEEIAARATALATTIANARINAKPGDIFSIEVATVFATLIRQEYSRRSDSVRETRGDTQDELPDFVPKVNQIYPTTYPLATFPPTLLPLLPKLPEQLEYRIVGHYLILRDVEANIIVDLMPNAVP